MDRVTDLDIFEKHARKMISFLDGKGKEVDITSLFYRLTLDSATDDYLLGKSVNSLDGPQTEFASAFAEVQGGKHLFSTSALCAER